MLIYCVDQYGNQPDIPNDSQVQPISEFNKSMQWKKNLNAKFRRTKRESRISQEKVSGTVNQKIRQHMMITKKLRDGILRALLEAIYCLMHFLTRY